MGSTTSRMGLPYPVSSDPNNVPQNIQNLASALDGVTTTYAEGLASARPTAGQHGRLYYATDSGALSYDYGTGWVQVNVSTGSVVTAKGDLIVASAANTLARLGVGANGQVLQANSGATNGVQWATVTGGALGLTGATAATRYVGATTSGAPSSGTFAVGDFVIDQSGIVWICTAAGSPGSWTATYSRAIGQPVGATGATLATRFVGATSNGAPGSGTFYTGDFVIDQSGAVWVCTSGGSPGTWVGLKASDFTNLKTAEFGSTSRTRPPSCSLYQPNDRSVPANTDTFMDAQWTVDTDTDNIWQAGVQPTYGYMRIPVAGRYMVRYGAEMYSSVNGSTVICKILLNGQSMNSNVIGADLRIITTGTQEPYHLNAMVTDRRFAVNDRIYFSVWGSQGFTIYGNGGSWPGGSSALSTIATLTWLGPN